MSKGWTACFDNDSCHERDDDNNDDDHDDNVVDDELNHDCYASRVRDKL